MSVPAETQATILPPEKGRQLDRLAEGLDARALLWISGYAAGLAAQRSRPAEAAPAQLAAQPDAGLTVLYGSQTGNARRWAERIARDGESRGWRVTLTNLADYPARQLRRETRLIVVISTQGDGDPPDDAREFMAFLGSRRAPRLEKLQYSVLALGDASYPAFCATGRAVDERLAELGGQRLHERGDCDLDIETVAEPWWKAVRDSVDEALAVSAQDAQRSTVTPLHRAPPIDRDHPVTAQLLVNQRITGSDTDKDIRHLELQIEGAPLEYVPGDSLGVWHHNPPAIVDALLQTTGLDGDTSLTRDDNTLTLARWLGERREITRPALPFLRAQAERGGHAQLHALLEPERRGELARLFDEMQLLDVLQRWPADWSAGDLVDALRPLTPRLYSIASSPLLADAEVHLTVARLAYEHNGQGRLGAASNWLAASGEDTALPVYVEPNPRFRLPADTDRDIVMIGAGTGIAPFRAFMQHRAETGAAGRNWLIFGAQHFHSQFLYQLEWQRYWKRQQLHAIDLAFSRDQARKCYVQHCLAERGRDIYAALREGAHFYVCGAIAMEKAVYRTLGEILVEHSGMKREDAEAHLVELKRTGRYSRDVY